MLPETNSQLAPPCSGTVCVVMQWRMYDMGIHSGFCMWLGSVSLEKSERKKPYAWLPDQGWEDLMRLSELFPEKFESLPGDVEDNADVWKNVRAFFAIQFSSLVFLLVLNVQVWCNVPLHSVGGMSPLPFAVKALLFFLTSVSDWLISRRIKALIISKTTPESLPWYTGDVLFSSQMP